MGFKGKLAPIKTTVMLRECTIPRQTGKGRFYSRPPGLSSLDTFSCFLIHTTLHPSNIADSQNTLGPGGAALQHSCPLLPCSGISESYATHRGPHRRNATHGSDCAVGRCIPPSPRLASELRKPHCRQGPQSASTSSLSLKLGQQPSRLL